jgi:hypothetical protein
MVSPGVMTVTTSCRQAVTEMTPMTRMPAPMCASVVPKAERGRPFSRDQDFASGILKSWMRSAFSTRLPATSQTPRAMPKGAIHGPRQLTTRIAKPTPAAMSAATHKRWMTPQASDRFHASIGPMGTSSSRTAISGTKVALKNGGPTEILSPVSASSARG